jgi:2-keto-4-pentenoate hydratase/2-oxohepta-3-ene-1,7-dioic acid hydratase in catechol pathway
MKLLRFRSESGLHCGVLTDRGVLPITEINRAHRAEIPNDLLAIIEQEAATQLAELLRYSDKLETLDVTAVMPVLPYDLPPKIWCIGLNYHSHAVDISAVQPEEPGSFMKPSSCMVQPGGTISLPPSHISNDVDAEGELGVIIGRRSKNLEAKDVPAAIFGYTTTLDLTALDILAKNPRYLTRAKSMDGFFSFGPVIVTADEIDDVDALEVVTEHNGGICSRDFVRNMKHRPFELVRFHSWYMTLHPGDLISTGCPKGARIRSGDRVAARIEGVGRLETNIT